MATANVQIKKILVGRGNTTVASNYSGVRGEITMDTGLNTLRIHDGTTVGGTRLATYAELANVSVGNVNLSGYVTTAQITAANANAAVQATSINSINANLGAFQTYANATFGTSSYSNANVKSYMAAFDGNVIPSANVTYSLGTSTHQWKDLWVSNNTIYIGNVPIRISGNTLLINGQEITAAANLDVVNANIAAANLAISAVTSAWTANAATQATDIDALRANITAANVAWQANTGTLAGSITSNYNTLIANAAAAHSEIDGLRANVTASNVSVASLQSNAGTQQTQINAINANVGAANSAITTLQTQVYSNTNTAAYLAGNVTTGNLTVSYNAVVLGNLQVNGTQTTVNTATLNVTDLYITVANGAINSAAANGAGLRVAGALANIAYSSVSDSFEFNKDVTVGNLVFGNNTRFFNNNVTLPNGQGFNWKFYDPMIGSDTVNLYMNGLTTGYDSWALTTGNGTNSWVLDSSTQEFYLFNGSGTDGKLVFGTAANANTASASDIELKSTSGNVFIRANAEPWTFREDGNLILPTNMNFSTSPAVSGTGIVFGDGSYQYTAWTGASVSQLVNGVYTVNLDSTGNLTVPASILPTVDNTQDLGSATQRFRHLYVGPGTVYIGNAAIKSTTAGNLILPGITRAIASTAYAEEVYEEDDQELTFTTVPTVIDNARYSDLSGRVNGLSFTPAEYSVDQLDGDGYIDGITITSPGAGYSDQVDNLADQDMWATEVATPFTDFNANDWVQIPFRVNSRAGESEYDFNTGGGSSDTLTNGDWAASLNDTGSLRLDNTDDEQNYFTLTPIGNEDASYGLQISIDNQPGWFFSNAGSITFPDDTVQTTAYTGGNGAGSGDRLTNGEYSLILDSAGKLSLPGNLVIDNGVISNLNSIDDGDLVVGSQIEVVLERTMITNQVTNSLGEGGPFLQTQSQVEVTAGNVTIGSQVINGLGDGSGSLLAVASLLQTNASNLIIGYATLNSLEESTLQTLNSVEVNSNNVLIGQRVTNLLNGNVTLDAFSGWEFSTDGNLTLPAGGDILNSNGQSVLGNITVTPVTVGNVASGAEGALWYNTEDGRTYVYALDTWIDASPAVVPGNMVGYGQDGNITLNEDARINYANGVSIINSVYGDSQVASFLDDYTGNIAKIGANPLSIAAASVRLTSDNETWTFAPDGVVTLPNGMTIESYGTLGVNASIDIGGDDTRIRIDDNGAPPGFSITANATGGMASRTWLFGPDGSISFPDGSTQTTAYTGGGGGSGNALVNGAYEFALEANGVLTLGSATISNNSEFRLWATDTDITVYRNGQDGYGVTAGTIETFTDNVLRTVTNSNGFELKTGNIIIPNDKGVVFANGVNILSTVGAGAYGNTEVASYLLNFDGDIEFTSSTARIGNVDVITVMDSVQSPVYRFVNGSKITGIGNNLNIRTTSGVPSGPVTKISDNQGWDENNVGTDLPTTGGTGSGLTVDVVDGGSFYSIITINNPGSGYTNGDVLTVTRPSVSETFSISVPVYDWQFGNTGNLTFPSNLTIRSNPFNPGTVISQANALMTVVTTGTAATYIGWGEFGDGEPGNIALVAFNDDAGAVAIQTGATTGPEAFNEWIFDADGTLTFPTGGNLIFDSSATSVIDGVTSITANGNVTAAQYNFANGVNIFDTITGVTSINTSVSTLTVSDASGDYTYGALSYSYAVNGASNSFDIQYSAPLAFGNVDINVGNVTATGTANVANLIISGTAPGTLLGSAGDTAGMVRVDSNYIYYCTSTFVPASWTVGWDGAVGNTLFLAQGAYPTPQVGWTVTQNIYTFTIDTVTDDGFGHWQITWTGTAYGSPNGGTATLTNPNPATIWSRTPLAATTYANTNVAAYLTTANISTTGNISTGIITLTNGAVIKDTAFDAIAFGQGAGQISQDTYAVAIGTQAGYTTQNVAAVAVGPSAGQTNQGPSAVAIGSGAGVTDQSGLAVAIGQLAGSTTQGVAAVAIGSGAGRTSQGNYSIILNATGANLNATTANTFTVAPVRNDVANVAEILFYNTTSKEITYGNTISVAGNISVAGRVTFADATYQTTAWTGVANTYVALGTGAGGATQSQTAVAIGVNAGNVAQDYYTVAIGIGAGRDTQLAGAIAIGAEAGGNSQGTYGIAIGFRAGRTNQASNTIILNATGANLNATTANTFTVAPVRNDVANVAQVMFYNTTSKEVTYGNTISIAGNINAGQFNFANGVNILSNVVSKTTGSWTVTTGTNTYSIQLAENGTYQIWVDCNIPNGILAYNATATVTNGNVPVVGVQYAWVYNGGGTPIDFTSIPNQFVGTANTIVRSSVSPSATTNRFDFGINNTSGGNVTVRYGYVKIS